MKFFWIWLCLLGLVCIGCEIVDESKCGPDGCPVSETELIDLPESLRQQNWRARNGQGSCCYAALVAALRAQDQNELATYVQNNYSGGCYAQDLIDVCEKLKIDFAVTQQGDAELLEWAHRTQRAGVIFYYPRHAVTFLGYLTDRKGTQWAVLLDNNSIRNYRYVRKTIFLKNWKTRYGGFGIFPALTPIPPELRR